MTRRSRNPTALIVDDEPNLRKLVRFLLADEGFHPIWDAADGKTAISIASHNQPDVVVLDYMLPGMDGEAIAASLHTLSRPSYIVLFSAVLFAMPEWADSYLDKLQVDEIADVALAGLRKTSARRQDGAASNN